ncbi:MAG: DUF433 domain-containing protein [Casimicrobiaceae bacterium]
MVDWKKHIVVDPAILVGKPIIKGSRIAVELILDRLADGWSIDDILASYPNIGRDDVQAAITFAAELFKEETFVAVDKAQV